MAIISNKPQVIDAVAGENLAAREYVFIAHPDAPYTYIDGIVPGRAYKTTKLKRHCSINAELCGFVVAAASAGAAVQIRVSGNMAGFTGLVAGATYQPADTAGTIERLENHRAALPNPVATAISTTELCVMPQSWSVRGKGYFYVDTLKYIFKFSDQSASVPSSGLTVSRSYLAASSSSLKGYFSGGYNSPYNTIDAVTFSLETFADVADLSVARDGASASSSSVKHYVGGGGGGNVIDSITFAAETDAVDVGDLSVVCSNSSSYCSALAAYWGGSTSGTTNKKISKLVYSVEGNASYVGDRAVGRNASAANSSSTKGYVGGGVGLTSLEGMPYATDVSAALSAVLATATFNIASASCALSGFFTAGDSSSKVNNLIFATETVVACTDFPVSHELWGTAS